MRTTRHPSSLLVMVPLFATLAACGGGDTADEAAPSQGMATSAPAAPAAPAAIMGELRPVGEYSATGHVHITKEGDQYIVQVDAESHLPQADYPLHIHEGRCADGGRVVASLNPVEGQEAGEGRSSSRVEVSALSPTGNYFVQLHAPQGAPIACGDLPAMNL